MSTHLHVLLPFSPTWTSENEDLPATLIPMLVEVFSTEYPLVCHRVCRVRFMDASEAYVWAEDLVPMGQAHRRPAPGASGTAGDERR
jgi:hypothetical protein